MRYQPHGTPYRWRIGADQPPRRAAALRPYHVHDRGCFTRRDPGGNAQRRQSVPRQSSVGPARGPPGRYRAGQNAGQASRPGQACGNLTKTLSSQYPTNQVNYLILRNFFLQPRKACPIFVSSDDASQPFASQQTPRSLASQHFCKPARFLASTPALTPAFRQPVRLPAFRQLRRASRRQHRRRVASGPWHSRQARDPWLRQAVRPAQDPLSLRHHDRIAGPALQPQAPCAVAVHAQSVEPVGPLACGAALRRAPCPHAPIRKRRAKVTPRPGA